MSIYSNNNSTKVEHKQYKNEVRLRNHRAIENNKTKTTFKYQPKQVVSEQPETAPVSSSVLELSSEKRLKRNNFDKRTRETLPTGYKNLSQISPWLDLNNLLADSIPARLIQYSRKHKCQHGRFFNKARTVNDRFLIPYCDHEYEDITTEPAKVTCEHCGLKRAVVYKRLCNCDGYFCLFCKYSSSPKPCHCPMMMKRVQLEEENKISFFTDGHYDSTVRGQTIKRFLEKYHKEKATNIVNLENSSSYADTTKNGILKRKQFLEDLVEKPPVEKQTETIFTMSDFPLISKGTPEGAVVSSAVNTVKATTQTMVATLVEALKRTSRSINEWMASLVTQQFYDSHPHLCKIFTIVSKLVSSLSTVLLKKTPIDLSLLMMALLGSNKQMCFAAGTLLLETISVALEDNDDYPKTNSVLNFLNTEIGTVFSQWSEKLTNNEHLTRSELIKNDPDFHIVATNLDEQEDDWDEYYSTLVQDLQHNRLSPARAAALSAIFRLSKKYGPNWYQLSKHGEAEDLSNILTAAVSLLPISLHKSMFKTVALFCKEIVPVITVTKCIATFSQYAWKWLMKIVGYSTEDTKTWIQLETSTEDSPIRIALLRSFEYKVSAMGDEIEAMQKLAVATDSIKKMSEYILQNNRMDATSIRFIKDLENLVSSTTPPPTSRAHEPFAVRIYGQPGTGKSTHVPALFGPLFGAKTEQEFYNLSFARGASEYWDGVSTRQCIIYDDFGQNRTDPVDLQELILLVSAAPFMANFANISGSQPKGMSIDPKVVICCSNVETDITNALNDVGAIKRRFHLRILTQRNGDQTEFRVVGGSMTGETSCSGMVAKAMVPLTNKMSLKETQMYIYLAYKRFLADKKTKQENANANMDTGFKPIIIRENGQTKFQLSEPNSEEDEFFRSIGTPRPLRVEQPKTYVNTVYAKHLKKKLGDKYVDPMSAGESESGLELGILLDAFCDFNLTNYMSFLFAVNVCSAINLFFDFHTQNSWWKKLRSLVLPSIISLGTATILFLAYKKYGGEAESTEAKGKHQRKIVSESGTTVDHCLSEQMVVAEKAMCRLDRIGSVVNAFCICNTHILTVEHFFTASTNTGFLTEGTPCRLFVPGISEPIEFPFERSRLTTLKKKFQGEEHEIDACIYQIPANLLQSRKNIVNRFWDGKINLEGRKALVLKYQDNSRQQIWMESTLGKGQYLWYETNGPNGTDKIYEHSLVPSSHTGGPGTCGAIAILADVKSNASMIAMHVARNPNGDSMLLLITHEMLKRALPSVYALDPPLIETNHTQATLGVPESDPLIQGTTIEKIGQTTRKQFVQTSTTLEPSLLFDKITPHTTEPSVLSPQDPRIPKGLVVDLFKDGVNKMKNRIDVTYEELESVRNDMTAWYLNKVRNKRRNILTMGEAINCGPTLKSIDMSTSAGYPFVFEGKNRKDLFLRIEKDVLVLRECFLKQLIKDFEEMSRCRLPQWFVVGSLKDERRPIEKVRVKPKTRLFTVCPIVMIILEKMFFGRFMEMLLRTNNVPYAGGVDRLGISWHYMMMDLKAKSDRGFGGDYECYDGRISQGLILSAIDIMISHVEISDKNFFLDYSEIEQTSEALILAKKINDMNIPLELIFSAVRQTLANPTYMLSGRLLAMAGTLCSGCWSTQLIGTLTGEMLQRLAWNDLAPLHVKGGYYFKTFVANKIMSDDNINAVVESATDFFNGQTYSTWLKRKGMTYTSADKKGEALAIEKLENISFLKNTTVLHSGFLAPLMEWTAALEPINWVRRSKMISPIEAINMNANCVLRAVFFHGREKFESVRNAILENLDMELLDWNTLHLSFLNLGYFPGSQPNEATFTEVNGEIPKLLPDWKVKPTENEDLTNKYREDVWDSSSNNNIMTTENNAIKENKQHFPCPLCSETFMSVNRMLDHAYANHQENEQWQKYTTDVTATLSHAPIAQIRQWYASLSPKNPDPRVEWLVVVARENGYTKNDLLAAMNNMINNVKSKHFDKSEKAYQSTEMNMSLLLTGTDKGVKPQLEERIDQLENELYRLKLKRDPSHRGEKESGPSGAESTGAPVRLEETPTLTTETDRTGLKEQSIEERTSDNQEGTTLMEKGQQDNIVLTTAGTTFVSPRAESVLNDQAWDLQKILNKWTTVTDVVWEVGQADDTTLYVADVVRELITSTFTGSPFLSFKDFRCSAVRIKAVMVGSKWHQGRAIMGFAPTMVPRSIDAMPQYKYIAEDLVALGGVQLDPSQGGTTEYTIPFRHVKQYLALEEGDCLGQLYIKVLSMLNAADGASKTVSIKLFFCLENPVFKVPRATSITFKEFLALEQKAREYSTVKHTRQPCVTRSLANMGKAESGVHKRTTGQPNINEFPREGVPIAARRAITGDPHTRHFGEKETNFLNYGKQYRKVYVATAPVPNVTWFSELYIENVLSHFWQLRLFHAWRGAINFKIFFEVFRDDGAPVTSAIEVVYEPQKSLSSTAQQYAEAIEKNGVNIPRAVFPGGTVGEFQIPYLARTGISLNPNIYTKTQQSTFNYTGSGVLYLYAKTSAGGSYRLSIWAALSDEFSVGIFRGGPNVAYNGHLPGWENLFNRETEEEHEIDLEIEREDILEAHKKNQLHTVIKRDPKTRAIKESLVDDVIDSGLSEIKKLVVPENVIGTVISCLDKPAVPTPPSYVLSRPSGFLNFAAGPEPIDKFCLYPGRQQLTDAEHYGAAFNECTADSLFSRPILFSRLKWTTDHKIGDLLTTVAATPTQALENAQAAGFRMDHISYISNLFKYWRGGLTFIFDVVATNFHEGRLDFSFHPNTSEVPADYSTRMSQYSVSATIRNTENRVAITVPYLGEEVFRRVWTGQNYFPPSATGDIPAATEFISGMLAVSCGAPLRVPDNVPKEVNILVYMLPASDFELATPSMDGLAMDPIPEV